MANTFLSYDPNTGLKVKTKAEIMSDLINMCKAAYGDSYVVDEGTEMYTFLDILASGITDVGNSALDVYNAFSFIYATGAPLDALVSLAGVTRNDGETDSQLRARYYRFLYSKSVGTVEGLEAKLLDYSSTVTNEDGSNTTVNPIKDVKVYENATGTPVTDNSIATYPGGTYTVDAHSILVILKIKDGYTLTDSDKVNINNIILDYKSLGCGVTVNASDNSEYFATTNDCNLSLTINIYFFDSADKNDYGTSVQKYIEENIRNYISNLKLGEDIQYSGIMSCIYQAYSQLGVNDYIFAVGNTSSVGAADSISYSGNFIATNTSYDTKFSSVLNPAGPNIVVPYTTYIDSDKTVITINLFSKS